MANDPLCDDCELDGEVTLATEFWDLPGYPKLCLKCAERRIDAYEPPTFDDALADACREQEWADLRRRH